MINMKTKLFVLLTTVLLTLPLLAEHRDRGGDKQWTGTPTWYQDVSVSLEGFGSYSVARGDFEDVLKNSASHGKFGAGLALNIFAGQFVGLKIDSVISPIDNIKGSAIDYSSLSGIVRLPTSLHINPYAIVGFGRNWDSDRFNSHVGAGLELHLNKEVAVTGEWRHIFESKADDYDQFRLGIRYAF